MFRGYRCLVPKDCTAEPIGAGSARSNHDASLLVIETLCGWVSSSMDFVEALERGLDIEPLVPRFVCAATSPT